MVNNLKGSLNNLVDQFQGKSAGLGLYPRNAEALREIQNVVNTENWSKLAFPYTFSVINIKGSPLNGGFKDFQLPLAPQSITQSEQFATSIKPTQGGTVVSHSGNRYKTLAITGTTGIAPFRGAGGVDIKTGQGIFQPSELKYRSGYEVFLELRNYFKTYYEFKKIHGIDVRDTRLIFKNYKDGEFLIIELLDFVMERQAAKPHLYDYRIECKVLGTFQFSKPNQNWIADFDDAFNTVVSKIDLARGVLLRTSDIIRQVESTYNAAVVEPLRKIGLAVKALQGIQLTAGDVSSRIIKNTMNAAASIAFLKEVQSQQKAGRVSTTAPNAVIQAVKIPNDIEQAVATQGTDIIVNLGEALLQMPVTALPNSVLASLGDDIAEAQSITKSFIEDTMAELQRIKDNCEDKFNLGSEAYDALFDRTATLNSEFGKVPTEDELDILDAFNSALQALNTLLVSDRLFKSSFQSQMDSITNQFSEELPLRALPTVRQYILNSRETLERIAQRELGDPSRWVEIVEINDLKYPYITDDIQSTLANVAKPGQVLLIPEAPTNGLSQLPKGKETAASRNLDEVLKSLGVDFRVTSDFDLALGNNDDLQVVAGADNMAQAVFLKLVYEKGDVLNFPEIGVGLVIGSKSPSLDRVKDALTSSLLQDPRIQNITDMSLIKDGSAIYLSFNLNIKKVDLPVPVRVKL